MTKYTTRHSLPIIEPGTDTIRSQAGDNLWKHLNALAVSADNGISMEGARAEGAALAEVTRQAAATLEDAKDHANTELAKDRSRLDGIEDVAIPQVLGDAKAYADEKNIASTNAPALLVGTEDLRTLTNGKYRISGGAANSGLGLPTPGHGFIHVDRNPDSGRVTWADVSASDPSTWVMTVAGGKWSSWVRTDGLKALVDAKTYADAEVTKDRTRLAGIEDVAIPKALSDAKTYADAIEVAAVEASLGPKVIAVDTDGTPYYNPAGGTHRIFPDADGVPYFAENLWPSTGADTNGAPVITF